jgi:hypothetical protein
MQDEQDRKTNEELRQIRAEMRTAGEAQRQRLFEAYVSAAHDGMQADVHDMPALIVEYLRQSEGRYPALMDVADGVHGRAAGLVMGLMLAQHHDYQRGEWPHAWSIGEAADHAEEVCAIQVCDLQGTEHANRGGIFRL